MERTLTDDSGLWRPIRRRGYITRRLRFLGALAVLLQCRGPATAPNGTGSPTQVEATGEKPLGAAPDGGRGALGVNGRPLPDYQGDASREIADGGAVAPSPRPAASDGSGGKAQSDAEGNGLPLVDESGRPLPQTDQRPTSASSHFQQAIILLFEAIRDDRPEHALPAFFPVIAYREVKAVAQPERDWRYRLVRNFERDVHDYHRQLGPNADRSELLGVEVHEDRARWMTPGTEGNKLGYWRVLRSELRVRDGRGKARNLELTSLISWRGEWYVVHLHGFE